jgi:hypothetical protein
MKMAMCHACQRPTGFKRALGIGTLLAVIATGGMWLVALPFYQTRCVMCGAPRLTPMAERTPEQTRRRAKEGAAALLALAVLILFALIIGKAG